MKKLLILTFIAVFSMVNVNAQEQNKFRVGLDLGYAIPKGGGGLTFALEPKYNVADNMNVGLRIASALMAKDVGESKGKVSANGSYLGTFDYYFNNSGGSFVPFVGAGIGYYSIANVEFDDSSVATNSEIKPDGKFGGLIRAGFEWSKFRFGIEYDLVPKTEIEGIDINVPGGGSVSTNKIEVKNSYVAVTLGFYLGGGKWGN